MASRTPHILHVLLWITASACATLPFVQVFAPGEGGYPCIRIPSLLAVKNTLLAFAECRNWTGDGCEPVGLSFNRSPNKDICLKKSTDLGRTWGPLLIAMRDAAQPTVVWDALRARLVMNFNNATIAEIGDSFQTFSSDLGDTWSPRQNITQYEPRGPYNAGPGVGIQLQQAPYAGRLVFVGWHGGSISYSRVWYSDNGGASYTASETVFERVNEAQIAELADGRLLVTMRNDHLNLTCPCQAMSISSDGGRSFGPIYFDPTLISPVCMASLVSVKDQLYFSNPASTKGRVHGVVRRSPDGGRTWPHSLEVTDATGPFAYSCISATPTAGTMGLLWETDMDARTCVGPSCRTVFSTFPTAF